MAHYTLEKFHEFLGTPFTDLSALEKALTAPGAEGDKDGDPQERIKYEGNRTLAQIGVPLHQLAVKRLVLEGVPRGEADDLLKSCFEQLEKRAKLIGFYNIIKLNPRQKGIIGTHTLRLVFAAVVGAVYEKSGRNESIATDVVNRLYFNPLPDLDGNQTTSLPELEVVPIADIWGDLINTPDTRPVSPSNDTRSPETPGNTWSLVDDLSPVTPETTQPWEFFESPLQHQEELPPTPSSQLDDLLWNFGDRFEVADYNTPTSLELSYPDPGLLPRDISDTGLQPIADSSDRDIVSETTIVITAIALPLAATTSPPPTRNAKTQRSDAAHVSVGAAISPASRKRRSDGDEAVSARLRDYIGLEKRRCRSTALTFLDSDLDSTASQAIASSILTLYFGIGSPEVLALLQELLKTRRERFTPQQSREKRILSPSERMIAIEREDAKMAYTRLRKRCHVYQLFADCRSESLSGTETFVTDTIQTMTRRRTPQMGNPQNLELARVSNEMLSLSYPDLKQDDPSYEQKKKHTNELRKLGQRLHLLVDKFGYGILGLIPLPSNEPSLVQALNITDEAILRIPDNKFKPFVETLDKRLGNILREMSSAVRGVVEAIFDEEMDHPDAFAIESCEQVKIVQYPRGSPELLGLILQQPQ